MGNGIQISDFYRSNPYLNHRSDAYDQCRFGIDVNDGYNSSDYRDILFYDSPVESPLPSGFQAAWVCENRDVSASGYEETAYGVRAGDFLYYPDSKFYGIQWTRAGNSGGSVNGILVGKMNFVDETQGVSLSLVTLAYGDIKGVHPGVLIYAWGDLEGANPALFYSGAAGTVKGPNPAPLKEDAFPIAFSF